jgi:hypothetical protein
MSLIKRVSAIAVAAAAFAGVMTATASSAQAANSACVTTGHGTLCVASDPNGYRASYGKSTGGPETVDFHLVCWNGRWFGDEGSFTIWAGQTRSYVFSVGSQGSCRVRMTDVNSGSAWDSPDLKR